MGGGGDVQRRTNTRRGGEELVEDGEEGEGKEESEE